LICIVIAAIIPITAMADSQEQSQGQLDSVSTALVATTGSISIDSTPSGATIVLDGTTKGTTPTTLNGIPVGSHTLVLKKSGYDDYSSSVMIGSGTMTVLSAVLVPATGSISVNSTPPGATIVLDGTTNGTTPAFFTGIYVGNHTLVLKKNGYYDYSANVTASPGNTTSISATLTATTGSLSVNSSPSKATIILDGTARGTTPTILNGISVGSHTLVLKKSGYNDYSTTVTVSSGTTTSISPTLTATPGSISVRSTPSGATIVLDGMTKGTTPSTLNGISVGSHTLVLKKSGYNDYSTSVTVSSGKTASVSATLTVSTGSISANSTPSGATIVLDGTTKGTTPANLVGISVGKHTLVLKKNGYNDYSTSVTVSSGKTANVSTALVVSTGSINVRSSPSGATIVLDGATMGTTPTTLHGISVGSHTLVLKKSGYNDYPTGVIVSSEKTSSVSATLIVSTGLISVNSTPPGATIVLDGTIKGITPANLTDISVGSHKIVLKKSGYDDYPVTVTVSSGKTTRISATLIVSTGSINVRSSPSGATIVLDGTTRGTTPTILTGISVGSHTLVLKKSGYNDYTTDVLVNKEQTVPVSAILQRVSE
jgi:hypothetical protein